MEHQQEEPQAYRPRTGSLERKRTLQPESERTSRADDGEAERERSTNVRHSDDEQPMRHSHTQTSYFKDRTASDSPQDRADFGGRPQRPFRKEYNRDGGGERPFRKEYNRDGGGERPFRKEYNRDGGGERPFRKEYNRDGGGERPFRKEYNRDGGGDRPFRKEYNRDGGGDRPFRSRPTFGNNGNAFSQFGKERPRNERRSNERSDFNGERPYPRKPRSDWNGERSDRPRREGQFGNNQYKKPYGSRDAKPYGERRDFGDKRSFSHGDRDGGYRPRPYPARDERSSHEFKPLPYVQVKEPNGPIRLNKFIANSGVCSRREADEYIQKGEITVNGEVVTVLGTKVLATDEIRWNGDKLSGEKKVYILLNKPKGFVTTLEDEHADKTVMDLISSACSERVYPVGRLDRNTTGVLLFTNDGALTEQLTHPSYNKRKVYQVTLDKAINQPDMEKLVEGVELDDGKAIADEVGYVNVDDKTVVGIEIHSGRNRIVRRMFDALGYEVKKLDRVYFAGLTKKSLERGRWRFLSPKEVNMLKMGAYE